MRNPLRKRIPRELRRDWGKLLALFLFLTLTIGFVSGFLVADGSMITAYNRSFEQYVIEDGHFILDGEAKGELLRDLEGKGVEVSPLYYRDRNLSGDRSVRIYPLRDRVNRACLMDGELPSSDNEIVIDRLFAENNGISVGDTLPVDGTDFTVSGLVALSDYSALFKNNTDMMFNASKFTVAMVTQKCFDGMGQWGLVYCYAWRNRDQSLDKKARMELEEALLKVLVRNGSVTDFLGRLNNQAIMFTGTDMGGDRAMWTALLYIIMVVLAFVFAVTTRNTIEQESKVVGTLRASGYTVGELTRHYMVLPTLVTLAAAVTGNLLGYTVLKGMMAGMYYHSYSLPTYVTIWNGNAFLLTTVIPLLIILIVNLLVLRITLSLTPLQFLRHDLSRRRRKRAPHLPNWSFLTRFRVRVILQNLSAYLTLFIGILLASLLLMFGMGLSPLLSHFRQEVLDSQIAAYQYILKAPVRTDEREAERYCVTSLDTERGEEISVYGIVKNSRYLKDLKLPDGSGEIVASEGFLEKYGLKAGDRVTLWDSLEEEKSYTFTIAGSYHYAASLTLFLSQDQFNEIFRQEESDELAQWFSGDEETMLVGAMSVLLPENVYKAFFPEDLLRFSGYFSDRELTDLDETVISSVITRSDLTTVADQLDDSMGSMFYLIEGFAAVLYTLLIYLLAKLIVERNAQSISMVKVLGYSDKEAGSLYSSATAAVVVLSLALSLPLCYLLVRFIYYTMMQEFNGWLTFYLAPWIYPSMMGIGLTCYALVHILQMRRIRRIPLSRALKNVE